MGFNYLNGKQWNEVTRDERFFCQRLYQLITEESAESFVRFLANEHGLDLPLAGEWEVGFEVCFYRDLWHLRERKEDLFSPKRTFDLCLFGEDAIVIIEAKAAVGFDFDQNESFARDAAEVQRRTGVKQVNLIGLCSSKYRLDSKVAAVFTGPILRWRDLATRYSDSILLRADEVYKAGEGFADFGTNSDTRLSGAALLAVSASCTMWWVGRGGGIDGIHFRDDLRTGGWRRRQYEVNTQAQAAPSPNFFSLAEFARLVSESEQ